MSYFHYNIKKSLLIYAGISISFREIIEKTIKKEEKQKFNKKVNKF